MSDRPVQFSDRGGWWVAQARPHPALRAFLRSYDGYWETLAAPSRRRTVPTRTTVTIINLGPPLYLEVPGSGGRVHGSFVAGMHDGHGMYRSPGGQRGIQLDMTPLGSYTLFGVPLARFTNDAVDLADLLGRGAQTLVERLAAAPSWGERFDLLDDFLLRRLATGPAPDPEVARAWRLLNRDLAVTVADLAAEVGWSRKHLTNRFREQAGLPPKVMARVLRFQRAVELLSGGTGLADAASAAGYYDQAHLNREFRALSGCTPTELIAGERPAGAAR
ncbi:helix-turn-helix domain-containing protein [Actinomadura livida]|uniref:AraC family transcriptional regulator n=1 Tax=Actinomadura livida TaxID=79909 RepID=A0A7W7IDM4_9ACTN|nr:MULTISPECIES: AraC family transcriptional regulator [Actinomadura]MBB4775081.1 AraC-like DNA-binding protein [Actinomadura catellatispora]GGT87655.1 AraC family transcriptional regulator [Actinomadura livida]